MATMTAAGSVTVDLFTTCITRYNTGCGVVIVMATITAVPAGERSGAVEWHAAAARAAEAEGVANSISSNAQLEKPHPPARPCRIFYIQLILSQVSY